MKKLMRSEEMQFLLSLTNEKADYVKKYGICPPNQDELFENNPELFRELAPHCKKLSEEILSKMMEQEDFLGLVMTRCLSTPNQLKFIRLWPRKVADYLSTLESNLGDGRGAYLSPEAEEVYDDLCKEDASLTKIERHFTIKSAANCPFAELFGGLQ